MTKENQPKSAAPDLGRLKKLVNLMKDADLVELEIEANGSIRLRRREERIREAAQHVAWLPQPHSGGAPPLVPSASAAPATAPGDAAAAPPVDARAGLTEFKSPIVGTFYRASSPEKEAFVDKGSRVRPETVLCIIEAMKVMNEIRAEMSGEIVEVLVKNSQAVEFGQPLFLVRVDK
ncbi:MAG: acetyl-CoA carboxylase biotin carboxyl carrier protein [Planctomycetes bacterium]|nr:acetyl-CoA carboxylase biotin carboxyl carrier protein [Planctomycetota bacterium]